MRAPMTTAEREAWKAAWADRLTRPLPPVHVSARHIHSDESCGPVEHAMYPRDNEDGTKPAMQRPAIYRGCYRDPLDWDDPR
jgi:hypothetical protein